MVLLSSNIKDAKNEALFQTNLGNHYYFTGILPLETASTLEIGLNLTEMPAGVYAHLQIYAAANGGITLDVYEDSDVSWEVEDPSFNNNRNSTNVASMTLKIAPTVYTDGTLIMATGYAPSPVAPVFGFDPRENKLILLDGVKYLLRFTAVDSVDLVYYLSWYEMPIQGA
jgi:hypothetical protein